MEKKSTVIIFLIRLMSVSSHHGNLTVFSHADTVHEYLILQGIIIIHRLDIISSIYIFPPVSLVAIGYAP